MRIHRKRLGLWAITFVPNLPTYSFTILYPSISARRSALYSTNGNSCCDTSPSSPPTYLQLSSKQNGAAERIAYHSIAGKSPGVIFCNGFRSVMTGQKALALEQHCQDSGQAFVRFDYRGHGGSSSENFTSLTLGCWIQDTLTVLDHALDNSPPIILVGSSMGAWIALHVSLLQATRVAGVIGIGAAPDFTMDLWNELSPLEQNRLQKEDGIYYRPSNYSTEPYPIAWNLIEESRKWLFLQQGDDLEQIKKIPVTCPVRLLHGQQDVDCHYSKSLALAEALESQDVIVTLIKDGDHRLSTPQDLDRLTGAVDELTRIWEDKNS